jgi:proteasome lid subunit RPN8/RPN11
MSGAAVLELPARLLRQAEQAARDAYPEECCGLLVGRRAGATWTVYRLAPSANVAPADRHIRFEIDPAILLREQRRAREGGEALIGLYHSHPDGDPAPSAEDQRRAWQPDQAWLILAAGRDRAIRVGAWLRGPGSQATFTPLTLRDSDPAERDEL